MESQNNNAGAVEIASDGERETRPHSTQNSSLPTDSVGHMDTIRLSDCSQISSIPIPTPDRTSLALESLRISVRDSHPPPIDESPIVCEEDEGISVDDIRAATPTTSNHRQSSMSITSSQEEDSLASATSTVRSRSDSSGTLSSNGSAGSTQVDWDELERSEEQAPRDEGSDEVCLVTTYVRRLLTCPPVNGIPPSQTRARE